MKKMLALVLALVMVLSLAACGGKPYEGGEVKGSVYTQPYFGFKCTLPADWYFYSDEQIAQLQGYTQEMVGGEYADIIEQNGSAMEMYASDSELGIYTLNVTVEKLPTAAITEKQYLESSADMLKSSLESAEFEIAVCEIVTVNFAGETHYAVEIEGSFMGMLVYETLVAVQEGKYMACITACSYMENHTEDFLDYFTAA